MLVKLCCKIYNNIGTVSRLSLEHYFVQGGATAPYISIWYYPKLICEPTNLK